MSESRKNKLTIDGGQVKEDDHVASYNLIPESDTDFRTSKSSLTKSKEATGDGAEEKLLTKEDEAKIKTRVDMADAKYVVGDHRNGDAKIELDANKRQFSGLTKEELLKYADDPFWVRLRWFMFIMFWSLWLCMLAGAIAIIIRAPKCDPPAPKKWFEKGPLVEIMDADSDLQLLERSKVLGVFYEAPTYEVLDNPSFVEQFKSVVENMKKYGIKVIVDLTPGFVSLNHTWFDLSEKKSAPYTDYFIWSSNKGFDEAGKPVPPNKWVSTLNEPAWSWSEQRGQFYLHQFDEDKPNLNFSNPDVVKQFSDVITKYMAAGASGVRLHKFRNLLVNSSLSEELPATGRGSAVGADHTQYAYWRHRHTADLAGLDDLVVRWSQLVEATSATPGAGDTVFTLAEESSPELHVLQRNATAMKWLRPKSVAAIRVTGNITEVAEHIKERLITWPAVKLSTSPEGESELATLALLLPAAPVLNMQQLQQGNNYTKDSEKISHVVTLRDDASVLHGFAYIGAVPNRNRTQDLLVCARWKGGHTGYVAVFNPGDEAMVADLSPVPALPASLAVHHVSLAVRLYTNYTNNKLVSIDDVLVPSLSTVLLSYVPKATAEH